VVITNPGGTGSFNLVISQRPAPFPPKSFRLFPSPSLKKYTDFNFIFLGYSMKSLCFPCIIIVVGCYFRYVEGKALVK